MTEDSHARNPRCLVVLRDSSLGPESRRTWDAGVAVRPGPEGRQGMPPLRPPKVSRPPSPAQIDIYSYIYICMVYIFILFSKSLAVARW
jgi:hypothetical protein